MMVIFESIPPHILQYLVIPLLIMLARICDVTIGTIRIIFVSRGMRLLASIMGFFEVLIWIVVVSQIITDMGGWVNYLAYAAGFALGNYVGITLENRLAMGMVALRVITDMPADELIEHLKQEYHGVTNIAARGVTGDVRLLFAVIKRKDISYFLKIINNYNPKAYVSIEDVRTLSKTHQPPESSNGRSFASRMKSSLTRK